MKSAGQPKKLGNDISLWSVDELMMKKWSLLIGVVVMVVAVIVVNRFRYQVVVHDNDLERLLDGISLLTDHGDYWSATIALEHADGEAIAAKSLQLAKPINLLAVASDAIEIPGVSKESEHQSLKQRSFEIVPGTGDAIQVSGTLRDRWVKAATRFASEYNRTVAATILERESNEIKSPVENQPVLAD